MRFSLLFALGAPVWPDIQSSRNFIRIALGPLAIWITFFDMDVLIIKLMMDRAESDRKIRTRELRP